MPHFDPLLDERLEELRREFRELTTRCMELTQCELPDGPAASFFSRERCLLMERIAKKALWLGVLMIHQKRQGHVASTASAIHIMAAICFSRARDLLSFAHGETEDVVHQCESQKPHAVPGWDALLYLEGVFSQEQIRAFRTFQGPNAYPTHVAPGIQVPTGSLGLGPGAAAALAFVDQFNADHGQVAARGLQISIIGDSEFDEGVIHESIKERATRGITGWIDFIDYNRQSLDGNLDDRDDCRLESLIYDEERQSAVPVLTVTDSHPSYLSGVAQRLKGRAGQPAELNLGVTRFDRSGTDEESKTFHRIDCHSIVYAAKRLLATAPERAEL